MTLAPRPGLRQQVEAAEILLPFDGSVRVDRAEAERWVRDCDAAMAEVARLREREAHFARVLRVTDGGAYRNDWDAKLTGLVADRDQTHAALQRLLDAAEWLRRCREDVADGRVVRCLDEAYEGYRYAAENARAVLSSVSGGEQR